jgi:hypothetical protein
MIGQGDARDALSLELADTEVDGGGNLADIRHLASVLSICKYREHTSP